MQNIKRIQHTNLEKIMQVWKTGQFRVCSAQFLGKREFSQTTPLCHFELIVNPQLHAKLQKNIMTQSRKLRKYQKRVNFGYFWTNFGSNENSFKIAYYFIVKYLSTIKFMQNI